MSDTNAAPMPLESLRREMAVAVKTNDPKHALDVCAELRRSVDVGFLTVRQAMDLVVYASTIELRT